MDSKSWFASKTLWTNISIIVGAAGAYATGTADLNVTLMAIVPAVLNIVLRLVTKQPVGA
jgi:hypothetical protein